MLCKFCPLVNLSGNDVTYDIIVDAIMQIALSLSTKHKAGDVYVFKSNYVFHGHLYITWMQDFHFFTTFEFFAALKETCR